MPYYFDLAFVFVRARVLAFTVDFDLDFALALGCAFGFALALGFTAALGFAFAVVFTFAFGRVVLAAARFLLADDLGFNPAASSSSCSESSM